MVAPYFLHSLSSGMLVKLLSSHLAFRFERIDGIRVLILKNIISRNKLMSEVLMVIPPT